MHPIGVAVKWPRQALEGAHHLATGELFAPVSGMVGSQLGSQGAHQVLLGQVPSCPWACHVPFGPVTIGTDRNLASWVVEQQMRAYVQLDGALVELSRSQRDGPPDPEM